MEERGRIACAFIAFISLLNDWFLPSWQMFRLTPLGFIVNMVGFLALLVSVLYYLNVPWFRKWEAPLAKAQRYAIGLSALALVGVPMLVFILTVFKML